MHSIYARIYLFLCQVNLAVASTLGVFCIRPNTDPHICALLVYLLAVWLLSMQGCMYIRACPQVFYIYIYACMSSGIATVSNNYHNENVHPTALSLCSVSVSTLLVCCSWLWHSVSCGCMHVGMGILNMASPGQNRVLR